MTDEPVVVDGESLTPDAVERVARHGATVRIPEEARERVRESRERIVDIVESGQAVYGVNTGFGELVQERIPEDDIETLQQNLVRSHAAGTGRKLDQDEVRAMLVTRLNALVKGYSGVRERIVDVLAGMINEGVHPVVKAKGSLGASGDLAPLAHLALVVTGEGEATVEGERLPGGKALKRKNLEPATLHAKEGLGLINGTQLTVGLASLVVCDAERAMRAADIAGAMTTEATMSTTASSHPSIQRVRPHQGQTESAENVRRLTQNSEIVESHRNCDRVQDAYSLRCLPKYTVRSGIRSNTSVKPSRRSSTARQTTRSYSPPTTRTTAQAALSGLPSFQAGTSMGNHWPFGWITSRAVSRNWPRSRSGGWTECSTLMFRKNICPRS